MSDPRHAIFGVLAITGTAVCGIEPEGRACQGVKQFARAFGEQARGEQRGAPAAFVAVTTSGGRGGSWLTNGEAEEGAYLQAMLAPARRHSAEAASRRRRAPLGQMIRNLG